MELDECRGGDSMVSPSKRNRTTSSANYESSPTQVLASLQNILGVSLPGADGGPRPGSLPCTQAAALIGDLEPADLVGVVIGEVLVGLPNLQEQVLYLVRCYRRQRQEEHACGKRASVAPLSTLLASVRHQLVTFLALQLRSQSDPPTNHSPLYTLIAEEQMPFDMVACLVTLLTEDQNCPNSINMIFSPLLQHCLAEARRNKALTSAHYLTPAIVLTSLTKLKLTSNNLRPLADLLVEQPQWLPSGLSPASGLEMVGLSFLGPFLSPSVFPDEDPSVADEYFKDLSGSSQQQAQAVKAAQAGVQPSLEILRTQLHQLLHEVATNKKSRGPLLDFIASA